MTHMQVHQMSLCHIIGLFCQIRRASCVCVCVCACVCLCVCARPPARPRARAPARLTCHNSSEPAEKASKLRWQLGPCLGKGAFASVYQGINTETGKFLAVKQVRVAHVEDTTLYYTMLYYAILYYTLLYYTIQY